MVTWYMVFDPGFQSSRCDYFDELVEDFLAAFEFALVGREPEYVARCWEDYLVTTLECLEAKIEAGLQPPDELCQLLRSEALKEILCSINKRPYRPYHPYQRGP